MLMQEERELVVEYGKKMSAARLSTGTSGNISIYNAEKGLVAISPSGMDYFSTTPEDVVILDLDGKVVEGEATVNQSSITGESMPVPKGPGSYVYAGTVTEEGECVIRVDKAAGGGRYDNMVGKFIGQQVPAVGFSIGFERVCGILLEQGYQIPGAKPKMALLYLKDADFAAVLAKAESLRADYDVTVLPQAKKLGKQFGTLEAAGYNAVAFADNDDVKLLGQKAE